MSIEVLSVRGLRPEYGKVDRDLWLWFCQAKRDCESYHGPRVTKRLVQAKAKLAFEAAGIVNFKASDGWYIRWLKRWRRAAKQKNEPNTPLKTANNDRLPKKRAPRRAIKAKTAYPLTIQSSTDETISRISLEIGPTDFSSTDDTGSLNFSSDFVEDPAPLQTNHENVGLNSFPFVNNPLCQSGSPAANDLAGEFLPQQFNVPSEIGLVQVEERFAPDTSSLLNFDDLAWHDLSELSCFTRPPSKYTTPQTSENKTENPGCLSKSVPQMVKLNGLKATVKGKGKMPLDQINDVSACGNFAQHDLEDVSVSSDFVNQLNDEHSLELNLEYGSENLTHQILHKTASSGPLSSNQNFSISCGLAQPELDNFVGLIPPGGAPEVNSSAGPRSVCNLNAAEDEFSSEENDYIADAVMLSMQGDDFSILNCDNSPFQGALSVVDENSQSDKVNHLDVGMSVTLASEENLMNQEHVFYSGGVPQETCFMPPHLISEDQIVSNKGQEQVFCFSSLGAEGDAAKGQNILQLASPASTNQLLGDISLVENQDLFQISSSGDVNEYVSNEDVFISSSSSNGSSLSSACFTSSKVEQDPQKLIISESCSPAQNTSSISNMYFLPCSDSDIANHSNMPLNSSAPFIADNATQFGSQVMSLPQVTVANADSTTVLMSSSPPHVHTDQSTRLITLTSPNTFVISNAPVPVLSPNPVEAQVPHTTLSSCGPENILTYSTIDQYQPSTSPLNCESTKENGFAAYDLQLVESVLSEQDDAPKNPFKVPKKPAACLTEKGINTSKFMNGTTENNQSPYRRSSGDRYFPYFKEKVVEYAAKHTAKEAACYFGVNVNTVTMWTRGKNEVDSVSKNNPDYLMLRWLKKSRESGVILTREQIAERATQLLKTPGNWVKDKSRWFHVWASRLQDEEDKKNRLKNNVKETTKLPLDCGDKKALYPDDFKIEVVLYAEQTSKNLAASSFHIARKRVFEWTSAMKAQEVKTLSVNDLNQLPLDAAKPTLPDCAPGSTGLDTPDLPSSTNVKLNNKGMGRGVTSVAVDQELWKWFCDETAKKNKPKSKDIRAKAVELFRAHNYDKIQCSHGWLKKWSLRYGIALRHEGDGDLIAWCLEQFDRNRNIPHRELVNYAQESLNGTHKSEFKGSAGWLVRFCKRHRNLLSAKPGIDVEIPNILMQSISEFRSHTQKLIFSPSTPLSNVGCMDELPLNFTSGNSRSRLLLRRSSLENGHATVILSCLANGELLPPAVIFKGDGPTETMTFNDVSLLVFYQKDCCMTTGIMLEWLQLLWNKHVTGPSVLIADCYDPHCPEPVQEACNAAGVTLSIIPAGCSLKLQPLDLAISRLFEAYIYNRWTRHFASANQLIKRTAFSNNADIGGWIAEAYRTLKETRKEAICRSFLVTGLTSALNGAEDHLIEDPSYIPFSSLFAS